MSRRKRDETAEPDDGRDSLHHRKKDPCEVLLTAGMIEDHDAIAIVVSEETGEVRIFHHGSIFMEIEKGG